MHKKALHHALKLLRKIRYAWLLIACVVCAGLAVYGLRSNNLRMVELRSAVFKADEQNGDVESALRELRAFVFSHMNTNLSSGTNAVKPPIQLKYRYDRLVAAAKTEYDAANAKVVRDAEAYCVAKYPNVTFSQDRLNCARDYANQHPVTLQTIPDDLYKFDFASPFWTPDLAGWSIALMILFLLLFVLRYISAAFVKHELESRS